MSIPQISPDASITEPVQISKVAKNDASTPQPTEKPKQDTVTISKQAVQIASQLYSPSEEAKETPIQKEVESAQGRK